MSLHAVLLFVPICFALNMTFGPSNLLSMTNGARAGIGFAALAGIGRLIAYGPMMAVSAAGLGVLLATSAVAFHVVKFLGAAYLIWLGIKLLRTPPATGVAALAVMRPTRAAGFRQEFLVAVSNPKAIVIFTAVLPQFLDPANYWPSFAVVASVFLVLETVALTLYATAGRFFARAAAGRLHWLNRASGAGMVAFGALLAFAQRPE